MRKHELCVKAVLSRVSVLEQRYTADSNDIKEVIPYEMGDYLFFISSINRNSTIKNCPIKRAVFLLSKVYTLHKE